MAAATLVLSDVLGGVQELVELADRGLAHIFNEPWPPPPIIAIKVHSVVRKPTADGRKQGYSISEATACRSRTVGKYKYYDAKPANATMGGTKLAVKAVPKGTSTAVGWDRPLSTSKVTTKVINTAWSKAPTPPSRHLKKKVMTKQRERSSREGRTERPVSAQAQTRQREPRVNATLRKSKPNLPSTVFSDDRQRTKAHARFPKASPSRIVGTGLRYSQNPGLTLASHSVSSAVASGKIDDSKVQIEATPMLAQRSSRTPGIERVNDDREQLGIRLNDIRPDPDRCDVLLIAVAEMEVCKAIFAGWRAQLDLYGLYHALVLRSRS